MYYQTGSMRQFNNDLSPGKKSNAWQLQNEFQYAQRSKYQKSEVSYNQQSKSKVVYEDEKTERGQKLADNKQIMKIVPIKIRSADREDYVGNFRMQLLNSCDKNNNYITMHLTNDNDSLFLWSFVIREHEYGTLKSQQSLKVEFHKFPDLINQYLGLCVDVDKEVQQNNKSSFFYMIFEAAKGNQQAELKIIQNNKYKQSCHLNLKYKKANDEQLKIFLGHKYDKEKRQNGRLNTQLLEAQHKLNLRMQEVQKIHLQYQQLERQSSRRIDELERRQKQKIKEITLRIQEQNMQKQKDQSERNKRRMDELQTKLQETKNKYEDVYNNYQKANERIINLQSSQHTLKSKYSILEQQSSTYEKQNKQFKDRQLKLNQEYHTLKNQNTKLRCTIESLEDRLKQKDIRITENIQAKSTNVSQISTLEESLRQEKRKVEKLQQKNEILEADLAKALKRADDVATKLNKKKNHINQYKQVLQCQEQKIEALQKQKNKMLEQIVQLKRDREKVDLQLKDKQMKIKDLKNHIEQSQQHMQSKNKIISQLNKRLNQKSIGSKAFTLPSSLPTYTPLGSVGLGAASSIVGRQFSSTVTSTSESRMRYSPSPISTSPLNQKTTQRIVAPPFKKYRDGIQNDRDQQNSHHSHSHSRSPIINRLSQQPDPEQADKTRQKIGPIKFKK